VKIGALVQNFAGFVETGRTTLACLSRCIPTSTAPEPPSRSGSTIDLFALVAEEVVLPEPSWSGYAMVAR
jgi:hypothetical protein